MAERFDVIIVGARCAGSPLAILLARAGLRVCVVDRARFPSDTASTHGVQPSGVKILDRLGVLEPLREAQTVAANNWRRRAPSHPSPAARRQHSVSATFGAPV